MIVINELDLKECLKLFWNKKIFIVCMVIIFAILGGVKIKYFTTPVYEASGKLICARSEESMDKGTTVTTNELTIPSSLSDTYAELIKSDLIVGQVIQNLNLNTTIENLRKCVELLPVTTVYYQVTVKCSSSEAAAEIANEFMKVFSEEVKKFYEIDSIYIVDKAQVPIVATNMDINRTVLISAGIGFGVAIFILMLMFAFNSTVTNSEQIKRYTKLTTLVTIPKYTGDEDLITIKDSKSPYAESVKILRTNLQYMYDKGPLRTVAITSSFPGEGKSWLTANLAVAFANTGKKTLIIDADMRRGRQHKVFKVNKMPGLSEYLSLGRDNVGMMMVKGKVISKNLLARFLGMINKYIKIEKIPAISNIIYQEDYITMTIDDNARVKSLKKETNQQLEIEIKPEEKKTRTRKTAKVEEKPEEKKTRARKTTKVEEKPEEEKKTRARKTTKVEEKSEEEKKTRARKTTKVEEKPEEEKKTRARKTTKVEEKPEEEKKTRARKTAKVEEKPEEEKKTRARKIAKVEEKAEKEKNKEDIKDKSHISNFVQKTVIDNLYILPAGKETLESSELLATEKLEEALKELKEEYDMILIDTPPVSVVADGFIISRMVDTNMIVIKHGNTEINELNKIKNNIQEIGGEIIGTVINKIPDANKKYYNTYYSKKAE